MNFVPFKIETLDIFLFLVLFIVIVLVIFVMWFAYAGLLGKTKAIDANCPVESLLLEKTHKKTKNLFDLFLEVPIALAFLIILLVIPLALSFQEVLLFFLIAGAIYLFSFPIIFEYVKREGVVNLKEYLKKQQPETVSSLSIFRDVWNINDSELEKRLFTKQIDVWLIFVKKIELLLKKKKISIIRTYFDNFYEFIDKRSISFLTEPEVLSKILEWHYIVYKNRYKYCSIGTKITNNDYDEILENFLMIFLKIEHHSLRTREIATFFKTFQEHITKHQDEFVLIDNKKHYYIEPLFVLFLKEFYTTLRGFSLDDRKKVWKKYFLKEWQVTKKNLEDEKNIMVNIAFNVFLCWSQEKILEDKEEKLDKEIDTISKHLFPEVDSIMWDRILIFVLAPRTSKNKVKAVIERPWNFGFAQEKYLDYYQNIRKADFLKKRSQRIDKTVELALFLFPHHFTNKKLYKYITTIRRLKYKESSKEAYKQHQLLLIFKRMLKYPFVSEVIGEEREKIFEDVKSIVREKEKSEITTKKSFELSHPILSVDIEEKKLLKTKKYPQLSSQLKIKSLPKPKKS